jgi:hypothetical protein
MLPERATHLEKDSAKCLINLQGQFVAKFKKHKPAIECL